MKRHLIWDLPTRLFHWLLVVSFAAAWLTSGSDRWLSVHSFFGSLMLGLIAFRLVWGVVGGHHARFASFAYSPRAGYMYLRNLLAGGAGRYLGHNPAGSQAIYLLLGLGVIVAVTGIFVQGAEEQQLVGAGVTGIAGGTIIKQGHEWAAYLMLAVVAGHLAGVVIDSWITKENLPLSMVTGLKEAPLDIPVTVHSRRVAAALLTAVAAFALWWFLYAVPAPVARLLGGAAATDEGPRVAFTSAALADNPTWREECGACHLAFHPNLLPERSWRALMAGQASHFGSDLALDARMQQTILGFLVANAGERSSREAAYKIRRSIPASETPLRITQSPYWQAKHRDIKASVWNQPNVKSKANCSACHLDAEAGLYEDSAMRIPP